MDMKYYFLQKKVHEGLSMKYGYFSLPEMGLTFQSEDVYVVSEALYPLMKNCVNKPNIKFEEKIFDKERIKTIRDTIKNQFDKKIVYISLIGEEAKIASFFLEKKFPNAIVNNMFHEKIVKEEEIYIPVINGLIEDEHLRKLSHLNVTVSIYSGHVKTVYFLGERRNDIKIDPLSFNAHISSKGFLIDEYLFAEVIYYLSIINPKLVDDILDNLNCRFAKSLIKMHEIESFVSEEEKVKERALKLAEVLKRVDFNLIKDYDYEFAEFYC